jgi:hypothetical protein
MHRATLSRFKSTSKKPEYSFARFLALHLGFTVTSGPQDIEVKLDAEGGHWTSGWMKPSAGFFESVVTLTPSDVTTFWIYARDRPDTKRPIRTYADASQPLIVKGEHSGITIQVKPQAATATAIAQ